MSMLCDVGFTLALDDFGTGTASFRAIRNLSFKYLKLDGSLVQPLRTDSFSRDLVRGLVDLSAAHYLAPTAMMDLSAGLSLDRAQIELIAGRVSALTECFY